MSELIWIAVPAGGTREGKHTVQVVVVPRLDAGGLQALGNWAERVTAEAFAPQVLVDGEPVGSEARRVARPDVWSAFFPPEIPLVPWTPPSPRDPTALEVRPSAEEAALLDEAYTAVAQHPDDAATVSAAVGAFEAARQGRGIGRQPRLARRAPEEPEAPLRPADFHEVVAALREHPEVLRALGLIVDLALSEPPPQEGVVRVVWPESPVPVTSPETAFTFRDGAFLPAPGDGGPRIDRGVVDLRPAAGWQLVTIDIDHAVQALHSAAEGQASAMPAPRTAGVMLVRGGLGTDLAARAERGNARSGNALSGEVLHAEDLVLGYRLDVRVQGRQRWFSLGARRATHVVEGIDIVRDMPEEAPIKFGAVLREGDRLSTDEVVARWTGWSLGCPRPYEAPTTLAPGGPPAVRRPQVFDHTWEHTADAENFLRHEPVPPPVLRAVAGLEGGNRDAELLGPGGEHDLLVVRSDRDVSVEQFAALEPGYPDNTHRTVDPPQTTWEIVERHGMLDGRDGDEAFTIFARAHGMDGAPVPDPMSSGVSFLVADATAAHDEGGSVAWARTWPDREQVELELQGLPPGDRTLVTGDDHGRIIARLPQGTTVDLDLYSLVDREDLTQFRLAAWLPAGAPASLLDEAVRKPNPLANPARRVRLVHAVRKPLVDPHGTITTVREPDSPLTTVLPGLAWFGVDVGSTAQIAFRASWRDVDELGAPVPAATREFPPQPVNGAGDGLAPVTHDWRDTRRRDVTYTLTAVSRFTHFFRPEPLPEAGTDGSFQASAALPVVVVPNAATPPPITVESVVPAFAWTGPTELTPDVEIVRSRSGGRLRVALGRPWYATGIGEQLGVVVPVPGSPQTGLTEVARDPIRPGTAPDLPTGTVVDHPESAADVGALGFDVFAVDGSLFADVSLPSHPTFPLLARLALARFQPESVPGRHLSELTLTDFVPVLPARELRARLEPAAARIRATLGGNGVAVAEDSPRTVSAWIERRPEGDGASLTAARPDLPGWTQVEGVVVGRLAEELSVPYAPESGFEHRLVVHEIDSIDGRSAPTTPRDVLDNRTTFIAHLTIRP
jgi:hypothetical protein